MKELLGLIKQFSEKDFENLTLLKIYQLWKPQIFEFFEKNNEWRLQSLEDKIRKKRVLGKTEKDVILNELEDLAETVCEEKAMLLLRNFDSNIEGIKDLMSSFYLYYQTFSYELDENEELNSEAKEYIVKLFDSDLMRGMMGQPPLNLPQRFLVMEMIGYNSQPKEFRGKVEKDLEEYIYSTLPTIPQTIATKIIKSIAELWYDNKYYELLTERLNDLEEKEKNVKLSLEEDNSSNQQPSLSIAQKVLSIMILNKFRKLSLSQDRIDLQNYIYALTGNNHRNIGDFMSKFNESNRYLSHTSKKQNLKDYESIRQYFVKMNLTECVEFVNNQLTMINNLNE